MTNDKAIGRPTRIYILFHANCFDGTGAAYAAWTRFGNHATYIPVQYGQPFPSQVILDKDSKVWILDFSYSKDILEEVHSKVGSMVVLDHHKTAQEELAGLPYAEFDMARSGAVMAWNHFQADSPVPGLLRHVQDGDLWKFELVGTKEVRAALPMLKGDLEAWDDVVKSSSELDDLLRTGSVLLSADKLKIDSVVKNNVLVLPFKGYKAGVYNTTVLVSEIGNAVCQSHEPKVDFSMSYFFDKSGTPIVSFRGPGNIDVSQFAKELGGGGHKSAAGAKVDIDFIRNLYAGKL